MATGLFMPERAKNDVEKLVVLIPALNEERTIAAVIKAIPSQINGVRAIECLVVDDGSRDKTGMKAELVGARVVAHERNMGVGAAFQTGIKEALKMGADVIVNIDGDGQFNPMDMAKLVEPIRKGEADFVTTTRFADPALVPKMPKLKRWGNCGMSLIISFLTHRKFTDVSCGYRAYSREAALRLTLFGKFTYTQETFIDLAFKNLRMMEVPLQVRGEREFGKSRVASNLWRYAIKSATIIFRAARDYRPQYFFGLPGLIIFLGGVASGIFLLVHWLNTGQTYPYRSLVQVSGVMIIVGFLLLFLSMLADMLYRNRMVAEEAVYHARKAAYAKDENQR